MARQWVYWALVYHRNFLEVGSANVELLIDPPTGLMAEAALSAYQDGGGGAVINSVNNEWGLGDDYYFGDHVWRVNMSLRIVGGLDQSNINLTRARMVVREYDNGGGWRIDNSGSSLMSVVYDRDTGRIVHTETSVGAPDQVRALAGGKLDARAHDFVKRAGEVSRPLEVMPVDALPTPERNHTLLVDPTSKTLVPARLEMARQFRGADIKAT